MRIFTFFVFFSFVFSSICFSRFSSSDFIYLDPLPGAKYVNKQCSIIISPSAAINRNSMLNESTVVVTGSKSGACRFSIIESDDKKVIILKPVVPFVHGEVVTVEFTELVRKNSGREINPFSYSFTINERDIKVNHQDGFEFELHSDDAIKSRGGYSDFIQGIPDIKLNYYNNPTPGKLFFTNFSPQITSTPYLIILKNNGELFYSIQKPARCFDFNMQPNGHLTFFDVRFGKYFEMDDYYRIIDSFYCGNGYETDLHELRLLSNRHALLMSYDSQHVDMSYIIPGGNPN